METLLAGGYIVEQIDESLTYDYLHSSEENLWSILYLTGYLTTVREEDLSTSVPDGLSALAIPNAEIQEIFETDGNEMVQRQCKNMEPTRFYSMLYGKMTANC